jgi:hypothetical protein
MFLNLGALETAVVQGRVSDGVGARPYGVTTGGSKGYA